MKNTVLSIALLISCAAGWACAGEDLGPRSTAASKDHCPSLLTEAECRAHHRILRSLSDEEERRAYLSMHAQLLEERRAVCGCSSSDNRLSMSSFY